MDVDAMFLGSGDDLFGYEPLSPGDHPRCGVSLTVGEGDSLACGINRRLRHAELTLRLDSGLLPQIACVAVVLRLAGEFRLIRCLQ